MDFGFFPFPGFFRRFLNVAFSSASVTESVVRVVDILSASLPSSTASSVVVFSVTVKGCDILISLTPVCAGTCWDFFMFEAL